MARPAANGSIRQTLDHHATAIATLTTEVHGIKSAIAGQDRKLDKLFEVIRETQAKTGPGFKEMITIGVACATLAALFAAAIIYLANSTWQSGHTQLATNQAAIIAWIDQQKAMQAEELKEFRRARDQRLSELEKRGWAPQVKTN